MMSEPITLYKLMILHMLNRVNFPLTSEALRKKLGVKEGSGIHLFGARADFQSPSSTGLYLIISHLLPIRKPRQ